MSGAYVRRRGPAEDSVVREMDVFYHTAIKLLSDVPLCFVRWGLLLERTLCDEWLSDEHRDLLQLLR